MTELSYKPRGRFFEECEIGEVVITAGRTITEGDIVSFASLSGDFTQIHTDAQYAATGMFGQRVAHGLLVLSIAVGLSVQTGLIEGTVLAFRELDWKFSRPIFIGDTIHVKIEIKDKKYFARLGGGNVTMKISVLNQNDEVVHRGTWKMLVKSQEA